MRVQSLGGEDLLEEEMATHSSILGLENPMDGGALYRLQSLGCKELDTTERLTTHALGAESLDEGPLQVRAIRDSEGDRA